uniref:Uncharacterized protein n=1 Tax=Anopheles atroparvus TaxID=41427 RepID=A0A182J7S3_ANOAO
MKGYNASLAGGSRWVVLAGALLCGTLVLLLTAAPTVDGREAKGTYEAYKQRHQRQQMERQMQLRQREEKNSEFVKGKMSRVRRLAEGRLSLRQQPADIMLINLPILDEPPGAPRWEDHRRRWVENSSYVRAPFRFTRSR